MRAIAYTYEADIHCIDCTNKRYESNGFNGKYNALDNEGNLVHPLFSTDEWQEYDSSFLSENPTQYLVCGDCHTIIDEYTHWENWYE